MSLFHLLLVTLSVWAATGLRNFHFSNPTPLAPLPDDDGTWVSSPITVVGAPSIAKKVVITLHNVSHESPRDLTFWLAPPPTTLNQYIVLLAKTEEVGVANSLEWTFDVSGNQFSIASGVYFPLVNSEGVGPYEYPLEAPADYERADLEDLVGTNTNGQWMLFAMDNNQGFEGGAYGGWSLTVRTCEPTGWYLGTDDDDCALCDVSDCHGGTMAVPCGGATAGLCICPAGTYRVSDNLAIICTACNEAPIWPCNVGEAPSWLGSCDGNGTVNQPADCSAALSCDSSCVDCNTTTGMCKQCAHPFYVNSTGGCSACGDDNCNYSDFGREWYDQSVCGTTSPEHNGCIACGFCLSGAYYDKNLCRDGNNGCVRCVAAQCRLGTYFVRSLCAAPQRGCQPCPPIPNCLIPACASVTSRYCVQCRPGWTAVGSACV